MDVSAVAAARLWQAVRGLGVSEVPQLRVRMAPSRGARTFELVVEDAKEPDDAVIDRRGIRFYVERKIAATLATTELDVVDGEFVFRRSSG